MKNKEIPAALKVLECISESEAPAGANALSIKLGLSAALVGRTLMSLESDGYLAKVSNKGRILTPKGAEYLRTLQCQAYSMDTEEDLRQYLLSADRELFLETLLVRRTLELESVMLACGRRAAGMIQNLMQIVAKQAEAEKSGESGEEWDLLFHLEIARFSGNRVLEQLLSLVLKRDGTYLRTSRIKQAAGGSLPEPASHTSIIHALSTGAPKFARDRMDAHIRFFIDQAEKDYSNQCRQP